MADKKKKGIDLGASGYVENMEPVPVPIGDGQMKTLYVREVGYLEKTAAGIRANASGLSFLSTITASSVEDEDGNKFTDEEASRLCKEVADPLFAAVMRVNRLGSTDEDGNAKK